MAGATCQVCDATPATVYFQGVGVCGDCDDSAYREAVRRVGRDPGAHAVGAIIRERKREREAAEQGELL